MSGRARVNMVGGAIDDMFAEGIPSVNIMGLSQERAQEYLEVFQDDADKNAEILGPSSEYDPAKEEPLYAVKITRRIQNGQTKSM